VNARFYARGLLFIGDVLGRAFAALLRFRWVAFAVLAVPTYFVVTTAVKEWSPDATMQVSLDRLLQRPPMGKRVRVTCDKLEIYGSVHEKSRIRGSPPSAADIDTTTALVAMCRLDRYFLPVTMEPTRDFPLRLATGVVEGQLRRAKGDEIWMTQGIQQDDVVNGNNFNVYVDTRPVDRTAAKAALVAGAIVLVIMWLVWFGSTRRRGEEAGEVAAGAAVAQTGGGPRARSTGATRPPPTALAGKVLHTAAVCEITAGGLDARRENGSSTLVRWTDIAAIVARRLPAAYGGEHLVEVRSASGEVIRILPWTRVTGDRLAHTDQTRPRVLAQTFAARAPSAELDAVTQSFLAGIPADQLADLTTLS
jgi:hypothetical protein